MHDSFCAWCRFYLAPFIRRSANNNFPFSGEILVRVRVSEILFESEIPVVFRNADLGIKIPGNAVARTLTIDPVLQGGRTGSRRRHEPATKKRISHTAEQDNSIIILHHESQNSSHGKKNSWPESRQSFEQ